MAYAYTRNAYSMAIIVLFIICVNSFTFNDMFCLWQGTQVFSNSFIIFSYTLFNLDASCKAQLNI